MILHQLAVADAGQGVFFVGHVVEVGLHHPGDAVVGHQQVGLVRLVPQFVQQVVDAPEAAPVALTFWQKLLKLFGLYKG